MNEYPQPVAVNVYVVVNPLLPLSENPTPGPVIRISNSEKNIPLLIHVGGGVIAFPSI